MQSAAAGALDRGGERRELERPSLRLVELVTHGCDPTDERKAKPLQLLGGRAGSGGGVGSCSGGGRRRGGEGGRGGGGGEREVGPQEALRELQSSSEEPQELHQPSLSVGGKPGKRRHIRSAS